MAKVLATISGTALAPGVSKNARLYTREAIASAVRRAQGQIAAGKTLSVLTHHEAGDSSDRIIGRITAMDLDENGAARFTADLADTPHARTIASLVDNTSGQPFLTGMSIRGAWVGKVQKVKGPNGAPVETAPDLEFYGIDPTHKPGVEAAGVDTFAWAKGGATETSESVLITESVEEARVTTITEDTEPAELVAEAATNAMSKRGPGLKGKSGVQYADPGYLKDGKQRYELDTEAHIRAAWSFISQAKNAAQYTGPQLKRVKGRIKAAMRKIGAKVTDEGWVIWPAEQVAEALAEHYGDMAKDSSMAGSFRVCATNGPLCVELSSYCVDPADLELILAAAAKSASDALCAMDPDMDGDMDIPGAGAEDTDGDLDGDSDGRDQDDDSDQLDNGDGVEDLVRRLMRAVRGESAEDPESLLAEARGTWTRPAAPAGVASTADPAAVAEAVNQGTEAPMTETTTQEAAPATAAPAFSQADVQAAVAAALEQERAARKAAKAAKRAKAAESAPAAPVAESAPATAGQPDIEALVAEKIAAALQAQGLAETAEQKIARLVEEGVTRAKQEMTAAGGGPSRKGLVTEHSGSRPAGEGSSALPVDGDGNAIPMERWNEAQRRSVGAALDQYVMGSRALPAE